MLVAISAALSRAPTAESLLSDFYFLFSWTVVSMSIIKVFLFRFPQLPPTPFTCSSVQTCHSPQLRWEVFIAGASNT